MRLHLIIPGLLWPGKALHDTAYDLDLPALSWLLGRARLSWHAPQPVEHCLCDAFGIETGGEAGPPLAALRLLGEGGDPGEALWLCADPAHLHIERGRMHLSGNALSMTAEELRQIADALTTCMAEVGEFHTVAGDANDHGHAYIRLREMPRLTTLPPSSLLSQSALIAQGADAARWMHIGNESQMALHHLPLNAQRDRDGRPTVNFLWFWGPGALPPPGARRHALACGHSPLLAGLARWSATPLQALPTDPAALPSLAQSGEVLLMIDALQDATRHFDALAWRDALCALDRLWFRDLRRALAGGRLDGLRITAPGEEASLDLRLTRRDALKLWRRPKTLAGLRHPGAPA